MNLNEAQAVIGRPRIKDNNLGKTWKRPEGLTQGQSELLDNMGFPKEVKFPYVLVKAVMKIKEGTVYRDPVAINEFATTKYFKSPHGVGLLTDKAYALSKRAGNENAIITMVKDWQGEPNSRVYISREEIDKEMEFVLDKMGPIVVPSVIKEENTKSPANDKPKHVAPKPVIAQNDLKELTKGQKSAITKGKNQGKDAQEIAEEIGASESMVIAYMSK